MGWDSLSPGIRGSSGTPRASPFFSFLGRLLSPLWEPAEAGPGVGPGTGRPPFLLHLLAPSMLWWELRLSSPDLWGAPSARSEPPPGPASLLT